MKFSASIVIPVLTGLSWIAFAPAHTSSVYAQSSPSGDFLFVGDDEGAGAYASSQKSKTFVVCDDLDFKWTIRIRGKKVTGTVIYNNNKDEDWQVKGTYTNKTKKITLKATTDRSNSGCRSWFTCTGTFNKKTKKGEGSWVNSCNSSGAYKMSPCR